MTPTTERFRRLARSSPWRWDAVSFTLSWRLGPVRATVTRPDRLRVVDPSGRVLRDGVQALTERGRAQPEPELDEDGLATALRRADLEDDSAPMWTSYLWVAALDPAELADGIDGDPATEVLSVRSVAHHGREAWEARVRPRPSYAPLCSCCPLLRSAVADEHEGLSSGPYADAHLVRLDVGTGICVLTRELGGPRDGEGHELRLTEVRPHADRRRVLP